MEQKYIMPKSNCKDKKAFRLIYSNEFQNNKQGVNQPSIHSRTALNFFRNINDESRIKFAIDNLSFSKYEIDRKWDTSQFGPAKKKNQKNKNSIQKSNQGSFNINLFYHKSTPFQIKNGFKHEDPSLNQINRPLKIMANTCIDLGSSKFAESLNKSPEKSGYKIKNLKPTPSHNRSKYYEKNSLSYLKPRICKIDADTGQPGQFKLAETNNSRVEEITPRSFKEKIQSDFNFNYKSKVGNKIPNNRIQKIRRKTRNESSSFRPLNKRSFQAFSRLVQLPSQSILQHNKNASENNLISKSKTDIYKIRKKYILNQVEIPGRLRQRICRKCRHSLSSIKSPLLKKIKTAQTQRARKVKSNSNASDSKFKSPVQVVSDSQGRSLDLKNQELKLPTRRFQNFQKTFNLMLKLLGDEPITAADTQVSAFEKELIHEFLFKKKMFKRFDLKNFNHVKLQKLRLKEKAKRTEERLKFVFKKCINHIRKTFRLDLLRENKKNKELSKALGDPDQFDYLFYNHFFGQIAQHMDEPIEKFFHFRNWKNRTSNDIPKSITKAYVTLLKMNQQFMAQFEGYLEFDLVADLQRANVKKLTKLVLEWEACLRKHGCQLGRKILLAEFKMKKMNLPWGMLEIKKAIECTKQYISFRTDH